MRVKFWQLLKVSALTLLFAAALCGALLVSGSQDLMAQTGGGPELSPGYWREGNPGDVITFTHVLTNTSATTDSIAVEAYSERMWPVMLYGGMYEEGTTPILPLKLGPGMATTVILEVTVPLTETGDVTETTTLTATSLTDMTTFDVEYDMTYVPEQMIYIFLPILMRDYGG
jgi:hypothetical protein